MNATRYYGFTVEDIDASCPADLKPYTDAYKFEQEQIDQNNYMLGGYLRYAIASVLSDKAKYPDKPFLESIKDEEKTPEQIDEEIRQQLYLEDKWVKSIEEKGLPETVI